MEKLSVSKKYNYIPFYPFVWLTDFKLNACSLQTQGAWIRLMCYMHDSEEYGFLIINGKPLSEKEIQNLLKATDEQFKEIWGELNRHGVIRFNNKLQAYYSKRMQNDFVKHIDKLNFYEPSEQNLKIIENVIKYLNKKLNKNYDANDRDYIKLINAKILSGYKLEHFKKVIDIKLDEWSNDEKMCAYLRPSTLFGNKFSEYLEQEIKKPTTPIKTTNPYKGMM